VFVQLWILNLEKINRKNKLVILLIGIIYGIFIEVMQSAMNIGRSYEIDDMIANTLGCILGIVFMTITQNSLALIKKYLPFQQKGN
jgi:glycopeptide antibiotics resistance protein